MGLPVKLGSEAGGWIMRIKVDPFSGPGDAAVSGSFMMYFVPALLQTEEYAWKVIDDREPKMNVDVSRQRVKTGTCYEQQCAPERRQRYRVARE